MPIQPSSEKELRRCAALVRWTENRVRRLIAKRKKVHFIWDVDHVLVSGRSDDAFALLGFNVDKYFTYEERLITEPLEDGPWVRLARACGELHQSQDIVTARSSFLALRVMFFLLRNGGMPSRWQLFVGHQPKSESYRIILKSFEKDPDVHIFSVDDAKKHHDAFTAVAAELGMSERCHGILSPQVRQYSEEDVRYEIEGVMNPPGNVPYLVSPREWIPGAQNRQVQVVPDPRAFIGEMLQSAGLSAFQRSIVEQHREELERIADQSLPGRPKTDNVLFGIYELFREPR
jgi:hypothetical protein